MSRWHGCWWGCDPGSPPWLQRGGFSGHSICPGVNTPAPQHTPSGKRKVCWGSANLGCQLLLPPCTLNKQGDICSSTVSSFPQGSLGRFCLRHHSQPAGCGPEMLSPAGPVGRSGAARSGPAFPALCIFTGNSPEVKSRQCQQGVLLLFRETCQAPGRAHPQCQLPAGAHPEAKMTWGAVLAAPLLSLGPQGPERSISCSLLAGQCCLGIKNPKLKHVIASNFKLQRNEENVPCQRQAARAHRLESGDL